MSELMISVAPNLPPSAAGNANAVSQGDASNRSSTVAAGTESATESSFAAALKSKMDKKPADKGAADKAESPATAAQVDTENVAKSSDLSALLPFLETSRAATTDVVSTPAESSGDEQQTPGLQATTAAIPALILAAMPTAPAAAATNLSPAAAILPATPAAIMDAARQKQDAEAMDEAFASLNPARPGERGSALGKIVPEAAINADTSERKGAQNVERPANDFHALLEHASAMAPPAAGETSRFASAPSLRIDTPLGQAGWHDEVGQRLTWMVGNGRQQADLVLNPPQLGRIEVSLTMTGDQATAIFTSPNPTVREALESSLHRLREVLADAGVTLGQTQVGSESPHQSSRKNEADFGINEGVRYASTITLPAAEPMARVGAGRSMIDIFA